MINIAQKSSEAHAVAGGLAGPAQFGHLPAPLHEPVLPLLVVGPPQLPVLRDVVVDGQPLHHTGLQDVPAGDAPHRHEVAVAPVPHLGLHALQPASEVPAPILVSACLRGSSLQGNAGGWPDGVQVLVAGVQLVYLLVVCSLLLALSLIGLPIPQQLGKPMSIVIAHGQVELLQAVVHAVGQVGPGPVPFPALGEAVGDEVGLEGSTINFMGQEQLLGEQAEAVPIHQHAGPGEQLGVQEVLDGGVLDHGAELAVVYAFQEDEGVAHVDQQEEQGPLAGGLRVDELVAEVVQLVEPPPHELGLLLAQHHEPGPVLVELPPHLHLLHAQLLVVQDAPPVHSRELLLALGFDQVSKQGPDPLRVSTMDGVHRVDDQLEGA